MSKFIAAIINSLNHNASLENALDFHRKNSEPDPEIQRGKQIGKRHLSGIALYQTGGMIHHPPCLHSLRVTAPLSSDSSYT